MADPKPKLVIVYGTGTNNTRAVAEGIEIGAQDEGVDTVLLNVADLKGRDRCRDHRCTGSCDRDYSTMGIERASNPMLQLNRQEFIRHKTAEHHERPPYFRVMERYNLEGPPLMGLMPSPPPLTPDEFKDSMERGQLLSMPEPRPPLEVLISGALTASGWRGSLRMGLWSCPITSRFCSFLSCTTIWMWLSDTLCGWATRISEDT